MVINLASTYSSFLLLDKIMAGSISVSSETFEITSNKISDFFIFAHYLFSPLYQSLIAVQTKKPQTHKDYKSKSSPGL
jgi:hypothetical protein